MTAIPSRPNGRRTRLVLRLFVVCVLCGMLANPADALIIRQSVAMGGGTSFPFGPENFREQWNAGLGLSGALVIKLIPRLTLGLEVGYYRHEFDIKHFQDEIEARFPGVSVGGNDLFVIPVSLVGELDLLGRGSTKPYLRIGAGVYRIDATAFTSSGPGAADVQRLIEDPSETVAGTLIGLGVRTPIALGVNLFIDATYHIANTEGETTSFVPLRVGVRF